MAIWMYGFGGSDQEGDGLGWMDHTPLTVTATNNLDNFDLDSSGL